MRSIKFRAWWPENKQVVYKIGLEGHGIWQRHGVVAMQFTGLFDKHGREIYEGDVVSFQQEPMVQKLDDPDATLRVIGWKEDEARFAFFRLDGLEQGSGFTFVETNMRMLSVIGNIHENPELLT